MKKIILILSIIAMFAILATSCKKSCQCYNMFTEKKVGVGSSLITEEECVGYKDRCRCGTECKWE